jgi:hypothetical protein
MGKFAMLLYDTATTTNSWGAVLVRVSGVADTAQIILDGFLNVETDDIIQMTGVVQEFPLNSMNSVTQFQPVPGRPITILSSNAPHPQPIPMQVGDFYRGISIAPPSTYPVRYSTGEPLEGMIVEFHNLTVDAKFNQGRGTFSAVDESGNQISMYDMSHFFTKGHGIQIPISGDSLWRYIYDSVLVVGTKVDTIRGVITTVSGSEGPRGYRISPVYRGDIVFGIALPGISQHRRNPVVVPPDSAARISVRVVRQPGGFPLGAVSLLYSLNNGPLVTLPMTLNTSDTTYRATIPQQPENTFVHYFVKAADDHGNIAILANSSSDVSADTSRGFFFYTVLSRALTIQDIQQTPYVNGRSGYIGAVVTVKGIVTADTSDIKFASSTSANSPWYLQSTSQPWSGIWVTDTTMMPRRKGDSISVTGTVAEQFEVTRIQNFSSAPVVFATNRPLPSPVVLTTGRFSGANGDPNAEPYEGMLVRFNNLTVADSNLWTYNVPEEPAVDDGTGPMLLRMDGKSTFSTNLADTIFGYTILRPGRHVSFVQGIMWFSFRRYKPTPRTNSDYGTVTSVQIDHEPGTPNEFSLAQNYPNPFNPTTMIEYNLPGSVPVSLKIYNLLGQEVETLVNDTQAPGKYTVRFDAGRYATGIYFYTLHAGNYLQVKKMLLLK